MKTEGNRWLETLIATAKQLILDGNSAKAVLFLHKGQKTEMVDLNSLPDKAFWSRFMRFLILNMKPDEYVFIGESWMKKLDAKGSDDSSDRELIASGKKAVSEYDDKEECLIVAHGRIKLGERVGVIRFKRQGKKVIFSELEWFDGNFSGRLANLWNPFGDTMNMN